MRLFLRGGVQKWRKRTVIRSDLLILQSQFTPTGATYYI